ncbi:MAG TPA: xanthine dehydrogenase family protein subunit M [Aggregatilineaceae bacterium]|nr:xanthine dehydrogenase family protein subunit M [Aggregatilineaceae bacterium]
MTISAVRLWDEYVVTRSVPDALEALRFYGEQACFIAGGTDLILLLDQTHKILPAVIDISSIPELREVYSDGNEIVIGAGVTFGDLLLSPLIATYAPSLQQAAMTVGSTQIRNLATLAGNIVNASPAADGMPPLFTLDARVVIAGPGGTERQVALEQFVLGPRRVDLVFGEMVTHVRFAVPGPASRMVFLKVGLRRAMAIATVNAALRLEMDDQRVTAARIAFGAVAPTVVRAREAEQLLAGETLSDAAISKAGQAAQRSARPIDDFRASAAYRLQIVDNLAREGLRILSRTL